MKILVSVVSNTTSISSRRSLPQPCIGGILSRVGVFSYPSPILSVQMTMLACTGELRLMFAQEDIYNGYMDIFFAENSYPSVSWIHDLGKGRYGHASQTLFEEAQNSPSLQAKHVCPTFCPIRV